MEDVQRLLQEELEALQAQFDDLDFAKLGSNGTLRLTVLPELMFEGDQHFVELALGLQFPDGYPAQPPSIELAHSVGLGSERLSGLARDAREEAKALVGDLMLGQLFETVRTAVTEQNYPEGDCILCLEPLPERPFKSEDAPYLVPCGHCFHGPCFQRYWQWEQVDRQHRRAELIKDLGAAAGAELVKQGLNPSSRDIFPVACPVCRKTVDAKMVGRFGPPDPQVRGAVPEDRRVQLQDEQMQALHNMQHKNRLRLERQREQGGLVDDKGSYAVSVDALLLAGQHPRDHTGRSSPESSAVPIPDISMQQPDMTVPAVLGMKSVDHSKDGTMSKHKNTSNFTARGSGSSGRHRPSTRRFVNPGRGVLHRQQEQ